jgi:dsRNA-specific ribonuclease
VEPKKRILQFVGFRLLKQLPDSLATYPNSASYHTNSLAAKVLADVLEALLGAAAVDGGIPKALACIQIFLPELDWQPLEERRLFLFDQVARIPLPATFNLLENLLGYKFRKPSLLVEAMTHASCNTGSGSLERLEFLGDSILDKIITTILFEHAPELSHFTMHLMRTAMVNADYLGYTCMEWAVVEESGEVMENKSGPKGSSKFLRVSSNVSVPLWKFMRHHSPPLGAEQVATAKRHAELRREIKAALERGHSYPWALLARLHAHKFYSDMVESLLGAVWIDSGSFAKCQGLVERMGILPYLRRVLQENVHIWHPKEELGAVAVTQTVEYKISMKVRKDQESREYLCKVLVGGVEMIEVDDGVSKEEVMTRAAEIAIQILKERREQGEGEKRSIAAGQDDEVSMDDNVEMSMDI